MTSETARDQIVRVVLVDDQPLMTAGIQMILQTDPGIRVVATATDGDAGVEAARRERPDLVCMDVQMPGTDGLTATRQITTDSDLDCAVLMLTTFEREDYLVEALRAGACGYLLKNTRPEQLIAAVRSAAAGDALVAPELTGALIQRALSPAEPASSQVGEAVHVDPTTPIHVSSVVSLTPREADVLRLMAEGLANEEIANSMVVSVTTVKTHVSNILMKLGARDRVQAVVWAYRHAVVR